MVGMHSGKHPEDPLEDETCRRILLLTSNKELTGPAIAYALDIPLTVCYQKLAFLMRSGYLTVAGYSVTARKRAHKIYRAKLDGVEVYYSRDQVMMRVPKRRARVGGMEIEVVVPERRTSK